MFTFILIIQNIKNPENSILKRLKVYEKNIINIYFFLFFISRE